MTHFVIGAGATYAESISQGIEPSRRPPLIKDFAKKIWDNYTPYPVLWNFLTSLGITTIEGDPREQFYQLENQGKVNIEIFLEYAWKYRDIDTAIKSGPYPPGYIAGLETVSAGKNAVSVGPSSSRFWDNLLLHGIGSPLSFIMLYCFHENGKGWKTFSLTKSILKLVNPSDLILNLNYDTVVELALGQNQTDFTYAPKVKSNTVCVAKPHGSLNMFANSQGFGFGNPEWLGAPTRSGYKSYSGIIVPRLSKTYAQQPIAKMILDSIRMRRPEKLVFWGIGCTESDIDLIEIYNEWNLSCKEVDIINPSMDVAEKLKDILQRDVNHFADLEAWFSGSSPNRAVDALRLLTPLSASGASPKVFFVTAFADAVR